MEVREFLGGKLVRDNDPGRLIGLGYDIVAHEEDGLNLLMRLRYKVGEEAAEIAAAGDGAVAGELADIRQALSDLCTHAGIKPGALRVRPPEEIAGLIPDKDEDEAIKDLSASLVIASVGLFACEDDDLPDRIPGIIDLVQAITTVTKTRDRVRAEMASRLRERGGFLGGKILERMEKNG